MTAENRSTPQAPSNGSGKKSTLSRDFASSLVVFLVALPLCMGVSIASGVPVAAGLVTGIVAGIVVGFLAGCPLQVSGPAAGLTVIVYQAVQEHGFPMLGLIVFLAGIIQLVAGFLRFGQLFRAVSPAVVHGMLAGIGILILGSQIHVMFDQSPSGKGVKNIFKIPESVSSALASPQLPATDMRPSLHSLQLEFGDLHHRQSQLRTQIEAKLPDLMLPIRPDQKIDLSAFIPEQQKILDDLAAIQARGLEVYAAFPDKLPRIQEVNAQALELQQTNLQTLQENRVDLAEQGQVMAEQAIAKSRDLYKHHEFAGLLGVMTIMLLVGWKLLARGPMKMIPAPLIGVVVAATVAAIWKLPVLYVEIPNQILEDLHMLSLETFKNAQWGGILVTATVIAVVASAETLLCATAVDSLHSGPRTNYDKELSSQGVGNLICGFFGALPMTGVIVRSSANVQAGAQTRLSSILHGVWFLVFVLLLASLLKLIPTSALAAILVYTGYKLVDLKAVKKLARYGWSEVFIWATTVIVIVVEDLLIGVLTGLALAMGKLVLKFSAMSVNVENSSSGVSTVSISGNASFLRLPKLARGLDRVPEKSHATFDFSELQYFDQACMEVLQQWAEQHKNQGGTVEVDWDALEAFARGDKLSYTALHSRTHDAQVPQSVG